MHFSDKARLKPKLTTLYLRNAEVPGLETKVRRSKISDIPKEPIGTKKHAPPKETVVSFGISFSPTIRDRFASAQALFAHLDRFRSACRPTRERVGCGRRWARGVEEGFLLILGNDRVL